MPLVQSGVELVLDKSKFDIAGVANSARRVDDALDGIVDSANAAERALAGIGGNVSVKIGIDDTDITGVEGRIDSLNAETPTVTVNVEDAELTNARGMVSDIDSAAPSLTVDVDNGELTAAENQVSDINTAAPSVTVNADSSALAGVQAQLETIQNLAIVNLVVTVAGDPQALIQSIPGLGALLDIDNAVRTLDASTQGAIKNADVLINQLYNEGFAESREEIAATLAEISNLGVAQSDLTEVASGLFATQEAIAGMGKEAPGISELLRITNALKETGIAETFQDANDIIVAGFQSSIGISGDFIGDLGEFTTVFADLDATAQQTLSTLDTGLAGGVDTISRMTEGILSFNALMRTGGDEFESALAFLDEGAGTNLAEQFDLAQQGEMTGADFMAAVLDGARKFAEFHGDQELSPVLTALFGSTVENIGTEAILNIDPNAGQFSDLEGRADEAAATVRDSLNEAFEQVGRTLETSITEALDTSLNVSGRLQTLRDQLQTFADELQSGTAFGEALELSFGLTGIDTFIANFERIIGNLQIVFLQLVSDIGELMGKDTSVVDMEVARLAEGQLAFDLQVANPEEVQGLIATAVERGVDAGSVADALSIAINEALAAGDTVLAAQLSRQIQQVANEPIIVRGVEFAAGTSPEDIFADLEVQTLANGLFGQAAAAEELRGEIEAAIAAGASGGSEQVQASVEEAAVAARAAFFTAMEAGNVGEALDLGAALDDPAMIARASQAANAMFLAAQEAYNNMDFSTFNTLATQLQDPALLEQARVWGESIKLQIQGELQAGNLFDAAALARQFGDPELLASINEYKNTNRQAQQDVARESSNTASSVRGSLNEETLAMEEQKPFWKDWSEYAIEQVNLLGERIIYVSEQLTGLNANLATDMGGGTGTEGGGGMATGGTATGRTLVGEEGPEIVGFAQPAGVINAANSSVLMRAISAFAGGGGGTNITNYNINFSSTMNAQNIAQADAYGTRTSSALRGFGA